MIPPSAPLVFTKTTSSVSSNTLPLDNRASAAVVTVTGMQAINMTVGLNSDLILSVTAGNGFTVYANITENFPGKNLALAGAGFVTLLGQDKCAGITAIEKGVPDVASIVNYGQPNSLGNGSIESDAPSDVGLALHAGTLQSTAATPQSIECTVRVNAEGSAGFTGGANFGASDRGPTATLTFTATSSPDFFEQGGTRTLIFAGSNTFALATPEVSRTTTVVGTWDTTATNSSFSGFTI